jgi:hypothetical protein
MKRKRYYKRRRFSRKTRKHSKKTIFERGGYRL